MGVFVLGPQEAHEIERMVNYAKAHPLTADAIQEIVARRTCVGDDELRRAEFPVGIRVCFSIEQHPCGWCRHISLSRADSQQPPHPAVVEMLMPEFGFRSENLRRRILPSDLEKGARYGLIHAGLEDGGRVVDLIELDLDLEKELLIGE